MTLRCERILILIFFLVYVITVYEKGFSISSSSSSGDLKTMSISPMIVPIRVEPLAPPITNFEHEGRRLECLSLVASQVDKLDRMTLVRMPRRKATAFLASEALKVQGDFVEAGVFRGGTAIIMHSILACNNETDRTLWLADSFAGLPKPEWHEGDLGGKQEAWDGLSRKWTASQGAFTAFTRKKSV
jgi:hypothetical protein